MVNEARDSIKVILKKRAITGVGVVVLFQIVLFSVYSGLSFLNIRHPLLWIYCFTGTLFSLKSWLSFAPALIAMILANLVSLSNLTGNVEKIPKTRYDTIKNSLSWRTLIRVISLLLLIFFVSITYINLTGQSLVKPCREQSQLNCLNEENIFVVCCAYFTGFLYVLKRQVMSKHIIEFPVIRQIAFLRLRDECYTTLKECLAKTFKTIVYFVPLYFFFGNIISQMLRFVLGAYVESDNLYSIFLLIKSWIMSAAVYTCLKLMEKSMDIYLTQNLDLPLPKLINLLESSNAPFVKELGFQDLALLSAGRGGNSVAEIYALSLPGGIPHNWNTVLQQCLHVIDSFQKELDGGNNISTVPSKPIPIEKDQGPRILRGLRRLTSPAQSELNNSYYHYSTTARPQPQIIEFGLPQSPVASINVSKPTVSSLNCMFNVQPLSRLSAVQDSVKNLQIVQFMFAPVPDMHLSTLLENSQIVVWAISALCGFSSRALVEDKFGVAVNDLPIIVTTILSLRNSLQQLKRKHKGSDRASRMKCALKDATSRGLLKIAKTYADHLEHLPLPPDAYKALRTCANLSEN